MSKKKVLIVIDMQNDFIDGSLGTREAKVVVPNVVKKIEDWDGDIIVTMDQHEPNYLSTMEGRHLPVEHCITGTNGWNVNDCVAQSLARKLKPTNINIRVTSKSTFASRRVPTLLDGYHEIEIIGLCTDVCVVSNALMLKSLFPEVPIIVDASCCAGTTPEAHQAALTVMKSCHIDIINNN